MDRMRMYDIIYALIAYEDVAGTWACSSYNYVNSGHTGRPRIGERHGKADAVDECGLMKREDDEMLFERLVAGDQEYLRPLMERHGDALTLYVNGYVRDINVAEDLMIEAFSCMLAKRPRLHAGGFKPYLYKTARNLALDHTRLRGRFMGLDDLGVEPEGGDQIEDAILHDERTRVLSCTRRASRWTTWCNAARKRCGRC